MQSESWKIFQFPPNLLLTMSMLAIIKNTIQDNTNICQTANRILDPSLLKSITVKRY